MLELLGVGIARRDGSWLVRGVSARIDQPALIVVTSDDPDARRALLDAIAGDVVPAEGRVWVSGVPVTPSSRAQIQELVGDVDLGFVPLGRRSVLAHVAARRSPRWPALLPKPRQRDRERARLALERVGLAQRATDPIDTLPTGPRVLAEVAYVLARRSEFLLLRELDTAVDAHAMEGIASSLCRIATTERLTIVASTRAPVRLNQAAHVTIVLADASRVVVA